MRSEVCVKFMRSCLSFGARLLSARRAYNYSILRTDIDPLRAEKERRRRCCSESRKEEEETSETHYSEYGRGNHMNNLERQPVWLIADMIG